MLHALSKSPVIDIRCETNYYTFYLFLAIILRGLDALTTEETLLTALAKITSLEPKNCYVMRNFTTGVSMGCVMSFLEIETV